MVLFLSTDFDALVKVIKTSVNIIFISEISNLQMDSQAQTQTVKSTTVSNNQGIFLIKFKIYATKDGDFLVFYRTKSNESVKKTISTVAQISLPGEKIE